MECGGTHARVPAATIRGAGVLGRLARWVLEKVLESVVADAIRHTLVTGSKKSDLLAAGVDEGQLYEDRASGKQDERPGLAACLKVLTAGDALIVWKLDWLGRSLHHLVNAWRSGRSSAVCRSRSQYRRTIVTNAIRW